jgi:hypothetical protein
MAYMTRGSARSAAITRAAFRRRACEEQTPALFDNTRLEHDGRNVHIEREIVPLGGTVAEAPIPPTSPALARTPGGASLSSEDPLPSDADDDIEPDPDAPLPAYRENELTQRAAAADVAPFCEGLRARVLEFIKARGRDGATNEEISDGAKIRLQTVCGRVNELQGNPDRDLPTLVLCGGYRKTRSGSRAKVWVAV